MIITKQDLQKIKDYLKLDSVKDSQFKVLSNMTATDLILVLHNGKNHTVAASTLTDYIESRVSVGSTTIHVEGIEATDLLGVLNALYTLATAEKKGDTPLITDNISCEFTVGDTRFTNLSELLNYLLYVTATKEEVEKIVK